MLRVANPRCYYKVLIRDEEELKWIYADIYADILVQTERRGSTDFVLLKHSTTKTS